MSNPLINLAINYRPFYLDDIVGHSEVIAALKNLLPKEDSDEAEFPKAILLYGDENYPGIGKTTIAYCFANEISKNKHKRVSIVEFDAGSRGKVEDARDLWESASQTYFKIIEDEPDSHLVIIGNEIQGFSEAAKNAYLVPLENKELMGRVTLIMTTTKKSKVSKALLRRCLDFKLKPLTNAELKLVANKALKAVGFTGAFSENVKNAAIEQANGSAGELLSILEKVGGLPEEQALKLLDVGDESSPLMWFINSLVFGFTKPKDPINSIEGVIEGLKILKESGVDAEEIYFTMLKTLNNVALGTSKTSTSFLNGSNFNYGIYGNKNVRIHILRWMDLLNKINPYNKVSIESQLILTLLAGFREANK